MLILCACWHPQDAHERYNATVYCCLCKCPRFRPARARWYQFWRPHLTPGPLSPPDFRLLSARPEEIT